MGAWVCVTAGGSVSGSMIGRSEIDGEDEEEGGRVGVEGGGVVSEDVEGGRVVSEGVEGGRVVGESVVDTSVLTPR